MVRTGLTFAAALVGLSVAVVPRVGVVHADVGCGDVVGVLPSGVVTGASMAFAGAPLTAVPSLLPAATPALGAAPVLTAGAAAAGGTPVGLAAALIGGAAVASVGQTCLFLDVIDGDKLLADAICGGASWFGGLGMDCAAAPPEAAVGPSGFSFGSLGANWCSAAASPGCLSGTLSTRVYRQRSVTSSATAGSGGFQWQWAGPGRALTRGGVSIGTVDVPALYAQPGVVVGSAPETGSVSAMGSYRAPSNSAVACYYDQFREHTSCDLSGAGGVDVHTTYVRCAMYLDHDLDGGTAAVRVENVGSVCGQIPGAALVLAHRTNGSTLFRAVAPFYAPAANGWSRHYVTDTRCYDVDTGALTWRRFDGAYFWDKGEQVARPSVGRCATGEVAGRTLITKVPAQVVCASGVVCWPGSLVADVQLPTEWIELATAPDWIECLAVGSACGAAPSLDTGDVEDPEDDVCSWGSATVELTWCNPEHQVEVGATIDGGLQAVEVVDVVGAPSGVPASTGTPVPVLDIVTDPPQPPVAPGTTTGIDTGNNSTVCQGAALAAATTLLENGWSADQVLGHLGCLPDADADECWPSGWGWFNPAQWVLRPIKCALEWAFVPDGDELGEDFAAFKGELYAQFPFSLAAGMIGFASDLGNEIETASGTGCFTGAAEWSFGDYGEVEAGDVCIGGGVELTGPQRDRVLVLMLAPMVWALYRLTWAIVFKRPSAGAAA